MIESIFEKIDFSKITWSSSLFFLMEFYDFFLHNLILLVILHINILKLSKIIYIYICIYMYIHIEFTRYFIFYFSNIFSSNFL